MEKYKEKLYSVYASKFNTPFFGENDLSAINDKGHVWKEHFIRHISKDKSTKILEIGCGNGLFLRYLKNIGYTNYFGIDASEEQVKIAKKLGIDNIINADISDFLNDKNEEYDVVFARDVIEHFGKEEILDTLLLVCRSLKKNGKLIIQCPNAESPFFGRIRYGDFTHDTAFTKSSLLQILLFAGFGKLSFYPVGPVISSPKSLFKYYLWKLVDRIFRLYIPDGIFTMNIIAVAEK